MKKNIIIFICVVVISSLFSACDTSSKDKPIDYKDQNKYFENYEIPVNREQFNVEIRFLNYDAEHGFNIEIIDHDNLGFIFNHAYYVLERYENGQWIKLTKINESEAYNSAYNAYVYPSLDKDYKSFPIYNLSSLLPKDVKITSGHYRIGKIIDKRLVSCEFDLNL